MSSVDASRRRGRADVAVTSPADRSGQGHPGPADDEGEAHDADGSTHVRAAGPPESEPGVSPAARHDRRLRLGRSWRATPPARRTAPKPAATRASVRARPVRAVVHRDDGPDDARGSVLAEAGLDARGVTAAAADREVVVEVAGLLVERQVREPHVLGHPLHAPVRCGGRRAGSRTPARCGPRRDRRRRPGAGLLVGEEEDVGLHELARRRGRARGSAAAPTGGESAW